MADNEVAVPARKSWAARALATVRDVLGSDIITDESRYGIDPWINEYLIPASWQAFNYSGVQYPLGMNATWVNQRAQEISATLPSYYAALRRCPPAFGAQMVRALVLSQMRFTFRKLPWATNSRTIGGGGALSILERPWPNGTTGELVSRMEWHAGLAGNAYVTNWNATNRLRVLRPDWTVIVYSSEQEPEDAAHALDGELRGYLYCNGGFNSGNKSHFIPPQAMAHWSPLPDPEAAGLGMSWITPAVREIQGDQLATDHKIKFFENGATPNLVVKGIQATSQQQFNELIDMMEQSHAGVRNAYKTLYLTTGADATVVGANLQQIDFKATQGTGETRISMLSRVHPVILGLSEGLAGSSLNAGNFGMARRIWGDTWIYPTMQDICRAVAPLVNVPDMSELWYDPVDMPVLREDAKDAADIQQTNAITITTYVKEGFTPKSAVAAVTGQNPLLLEHTGALSVQLQPPGTGTTEPTPPAIPSSNGANGAAGRSANGWAGFDPDSIDVDWLELERSIGEAMHPGSTAKLMAYWSHGEGAAKIGWGAPGDFDRCRTHLGKYVQRPDELAGLCANLHHMALGVWPGHEHAKGGKG